MIFLCHIVAVTVEELNKLGITALSCSCTILQLHSVAVAVAILCSAPIVWLANACLACRRRICWFSKMLHCPPPPPPFSHSVHCFILGLCLLIFCQQIQNSFLDCWSSFELLSPSLFKCNNYISYVYIIKEVLDWLQQANNWKKIFFHSNL